MEEKNLFLEHDYSWQDIKMKNHNMCRLQKYHALRDTNTSKIFKYVRQLITLKTFL